MPATLESNLIDTLNSVARAAAGAGRDPHSVSLLAVTKSVGPETTLALARLGQRDLGENRLHELVPKREYLAAAGVPVTWHFIGHVQRKKARMVVQNAEVIHSVDSTRLLETLQRVAVEEGRRPELFLEVKLSAEEEKHGLSPADLAEAIQVAGRADALELIGLMTMAPLPAPGQDPGESASPTFRELARLAAALEQQEELRRCFRDERVLLSMGMSGDFSAAIAAGSHLVRIGTLLFEGLGPRTPAGEIRS